MLKWLSRLYWQQRTNSIKKLLGRRLAKRIREVQVGRLTLTCISSPEPQTAEICITEEDGTETVQEFTLTGTDWDGETLFPFWDNQPVQIIISAKGNQPSEEQISFIKSLLNYPNSIKAEVEAALLAHYLEKVFPQGPTNDQGEPLPEIMESSQLSKVYVTMSPTIRLSEADETEAEKFSLSFAVWWSYYDIKVYMRDWKIVSISMT